MNNTILIILSNFQRLISCIIVAYFFTSLLTFKKTVKINNTFTLGIIIFIIQRLDFYFFEGTIFYIIIMWLTLLLLLLYLFEGTIKARVSVFLLSVTTLSIVALGVSLLISRLFHISAAVAVWSNEPRYYAIFLYIINSAEIIAAITITTVWKVFICKKNRRETLLYLILPCYLFIMLILFLQNQHVSSYRAIVIGNLAFFANVVLEFLFIYIIDSIIDKIELEERLTALYEQKELETNYTRLLNEQLENTQIIKNNFANQLDTAYALLAQSSSNADAKAILDASRNALMQQRLVRYCDNEIVNAVITIKNQLAKKQGIQLVVNTKVPQNISIGEVDLCSIISNLLDSIMDSCMKSTITTNKEIHLGIDAEHNLLITKIVFPKPNPDSKYNDKLQLSNDDRFILAKRLINKYHGKIKYIFVQNTCEIIGSLEL